MLTSAIAVLALMHQGDSVRPGAPEDLGRPEQAAEPTTMSAAYPRRGSCSEFSGWRRRRRTPMEDAVAAGFLQAAALRMNSRCCPKTMAGRRR